MFLQVVPLSLDVRLQRVPVGQLHASDLPLSRVGLLGFCNDNLGANTLFSAGKCLKEGTLRAEYVGRVAFFRFIAWFMVAAVGVEAWKERYCWRRRKEFGWTCRCGIALGSVVAHSLVLSANAPQ